MKQYRNFEDVPSLHQVVYNHFFPRPGDYEERMVDEGCPNLNDEDYILKERDFGKCPKCGLKLAAAMWYYCSNSNCPCGLGSRGTL